MQQRKRIKAGLSRPQSQTQREAPPLLMEWVLDGLKFFLTALFILTLWTAIGAALAWVWSRTVGRQGG